MLTEPVLWDRMNKLFTVIMVLDRELNIVRASDTLQRYLPRVADSPPLLEIFDIKRPAAVRTFEDMRNNTEPLYLMVAHDGRFAVRGQVIDLGKREGEFVCFLGSPWLSWMHANNDTLGLGLNDFAPQDAQMDQLFYISTEKRMVEDLERLNEQLRKATENLKAAQEVKTAFFAQMSHELRTPLNGVVSALHLLHEQGLSGQAETLVNLAKESSHNLMQVINYVLDVSKLELSQPASTEIAFDLPEMIASVMSIVRASALEKGLVLRSHIDGRLSSSYLGDTALLRQCLLNLVNNAIKFTDEGEVNVTVTPALDDGMTLRIEVSDTGVGIEPEDQAIIFEPFRRGRDKSTGNRVSGSGLGLDIAKRNLRCMGGSLGVISTPGEGSTFWLELPCSSVISDKEATPIQSTGFNEGGKLKGSVLLVDDNETNLMLGQMILNSMGLDVICAASGEAAIEIARDQHPDLVLMDISMPGIDGFEATRQIRAFREASSLPIVALTAYASSAEREMSEACGMDGYLIKPIVLEELGRTLSAWLPAGGDVSPSTTDLCADGGTASAVDHAVLDELAGQIGNANLTRVINKFLEEVEERWAALEEATSKTELAREAHTLASTCRSFGLPSIGEKIACIEQHAKFGETAGEPPCIAATGRELLQGVAALKAAMKRYAAAG
ncbi:MAG: response regulator [Lysobacterales bacterium]|nr:MAG: response regulator [Xanthomonadales bacterium]